SLILLSFMGLNLFACQNKIEDENTIYAISTLAPHAAILEEARPLLLEKGYKLKIKVIDEYGFPNPAVASKSADVNFFQHIPFLDDYNKNAKEEDQLYNLGGIHIEPIGLYSPAKYGYKSIDDIKDGDRVIMSKSVPDHGRLFMLLESLGLIKLREGATINATVSDIIENKKNLRFDIQVEANFLVESYNNDEAPLILINGNYALSANLDPNNDAIALESPIDNPYINIVACRKDRKDLDKIKALMEVLTSSHIKDFIENKYQGSVVPV
ncbi:MetQ/NlpA family ABC transporter substrate-binding protein, partial [Acholeplasma sp. OttesenSCG-928-E16]|nr:MetQ/NlpA family ABC transporter substrate-binding protein [Acholeplasma sp. OttesenSCG-928-E16]